MVDLLLSLFVALLGLAGGIAVGSGMVALLVVFDLIPRLAQLARAYKKSIWFETALVAGSVYWSLADFFGLETFFCRLTIFQWQAWGCWMASSSACLPRH